MRAHSLPRLFLSRLYMLYRIPFRPPSSPPVPLLLLLSEFSFFPSPALKDRVPRVDSLPRVAIFDYI